MQQPLRFRHCHVLLFLAFLFLGQLFLTSAFAQAFDSSTANLVKDVLEITRVTPTGDDVPPAQQIVFQFNQPVVPVGRMERDAADIPIAIQPTLDCEWRWLNTSALACQLRLEEKMVEATRYKLSVSPGIETEQGVGMAKAQNIEFITARPKVTYSRFLNWLSPGTPLVQLTFNQPVTYSSVEQSLFFVPSGGLAAPVALIAYPDTLERSEPYWLMQPGARGEFADSRTTLLDGEEARRVWLVEPIKALPLDTLISLGVQPGLESAIGPELGIEQRIVVQFHTFQSFRFAGLECQDEKTMRSILLSPQRLRENANQANAYVLSEDIFQRCDPQSRVALAFTAPVLNSSVRDALTLQPALNAGNPDYDPWANQRDWTQLRYPHRKNRLYKVYLPEFLKAYQQYKFQIDEAKLQDEFGRSLQEEADVTLFTAHRRPNMERLHLSAVLEAEVDSDVPLYVTNIDHIDINYQALSAEQKITDAQHQLAVAQATDVSFAMPADIRNLLGGQTGAVYATFNPDHTRTHYRPGLFAQVSPFQVQAKLGHFNSLVWVTDFATGQPLTDAKISLHRGSYADITELGPSTFRSATDSHGTASFPGAIELDPTLENIHSAWRDDDDRFILRVEKGRQLAFLPLDNEFKTYTSGVWAYNRRVHEHDLAWGTTAQGIYKLGDTIDYKIYVRAQSNRHLQAPLKEHYTLTVFDPQNKEVHKRSQLTLNRFGAFDGQFIAPASGVTGWYRFVLKPSYSKQQWSPLRVLVSDFTPAPFKVSLDLNKSRFSAGDQLAMTASASLFSGGAYTDAELRVIARVQSTGVNFDKPALKGFTFGSHHESLFNGQQQLLEAKQQLDQRGQHVEKLTLPEINIYRGQVFVEAAVKDERGKNVAANQSADYFGRDRFVGLRSARWMHDEGETSDIGVVVVDEDGEPVRGSDVTLTSYRHEYKVTRVKGPGNAYLSQNVAEWVEESSCSVRSKKSAVACSFTPKQSGYYKLTAVIKDSKKREHQTTIHAWVAGSSYVQWQQRDDAALEIIPEQNTYKVGDTARYLVKNPYPGAQALVTVERYGVIKHWRQTLTTSTPIIEVPIEADFLPGFYLSVSVMSPRVQMPLSDQGVDLGKPAQRLGYVTTRVKDAYKELAVTVETDQAVYKPRDMVTANIKVATRQGQQAPFEVAIAVIDESVLALNQNGETYYDPYIGFNRLESLDVNNYSLLSRLVGQQRFEKKGANPGGGGGDGSYDALRNLFKFISYWNPAQEPDSDGNLSIQFEAPDNLTGWRVLAMAVTPDDQFGLGQANYKVNKETEIRPVMPNQVVQGDTFYGGFNLFNRAEQTRTLAVNVDVSGALAQDSPKKHSYEVKLKGFERKNIWFPVESGSPGDITFFARAGDDLDGDALQSVLPVKPRRTTETAATYGTTLSHEISESIKFPENIFTDVGEVSVVMSPSIIANLEGAYEYMWQYPYICWEQRLSKAVMASSNVELKAYLAEDAIWEKPQVSIDFALESAANFQAPNGGMVYWIATNNRVSPYLSAYTALAFNWMRRDGHTVPALVEEKLHQYLLNFLRQDIQPTFYTAGMSSSVRAVALAALAESGKITQADIQRYQRHVPEMDLFGKAHFLQAAVKLYSDPVLVKTTTDTILSTASQSGGKFQFNEVWDDSYKYLLATPLRSNCAVLSSLLAAQNRSIMEDLVGDVPFKAVRAITQSRGSRSHWENTQENVFCMNAVIDYAKLYEKEKPNMQLKAYLDAEPLGSAAFENLSDPAETLARPIQENDPGRKATLRIEKEGGGRYYYAARLSYDLIEDNPKPINSGFELHREMSVERDGSWQILKNEDSIKRGEIVRVDLFMSIPTARHFVVLADPIPGGLEPINLDLATASLIDAEKGQFKASEESWFYKFSDWSYYGRYFWSFYHKELNHDAANFYADYLPPGRYNVSYTAQAIAEGKFSVMPAKAEEMYDPDVYGLTVPGRLHVESID